MGLFSRTKPRKSRSLNRKRRRVLEQLEARKLYAADVGGLPEDKRLAEVIDRLASKA